MDSSHEFDKEALIEKAREAREYAYVPYSKFKVGAALLTKSGKVYTGCNVENAAYTPTNCAERTAIFKAISEGEREFVAIAVVADTDKACPPCGVCRQVMVEFASDIPIIMSNLRGDVETITLSHLLPGAFDPGYLVSGGDKID